ncbi:MAG TPA: hypothetical protein VFC56_08390 [Stellaceae bacterium]|nr:hypothetical protein [Stellaceae bacterium]
MIHRVAAALFLVNAIPAAAQQPTPLLPSGSGSSIEASPVSPPSTAPPPATLTPPPAPAPAPVEPATAQAPTAGRVFCNQEVAYRLADAASAPEPYRQYLGIFSDAAWTPTLCAALIVENVQGDGTATITYVFGPMSAGGKAPGGVLHGAGIVKDGALLFQNADGSQYAFKPYYSDLAGRWTAPTGQTYDAIFKKSY